MGTKGLLTWRAMKNLAGLLAAFAMAATACTAGESGPALPSSSQIETTASTDEGSATSGAEPTEPTQPTVTQEPTTAVPEPTPFDVLAFGDAADCREPAQDVADVVRATPGEILIVGDLAYPAGSQADFDNCFMPLYGDQLQRMHTVPGDNDYGSDPDAQAYFQTLGVGVAGKQGEGWWSFTKEAWQIIGINSACSKVGFCGPNSPQYAFVADALEAAPDKCRMIVWHLPRFTSSPSYSGLKNMGDLYQLVYDYGADILVVGNSHHYERFEPLGPDGSPDAAGIANFTIGTGGAPSTEFAEPLAGSAIRNNDTQGFVRFTLGPDSYSWEFVAVGDGSLSDSGTLACHNRS